MDPRDFDDFMRRTAAWLSSLRSRVDELERLEVFHPIIHGSMYGDDISQTVTIASIGVYVYIPGSLSQGGCLGFDFQNSRELVALRDGAFGVSWSSSIECAAANQYAEGLVMVNSTAQPQTVAAAELPTANRLQTIGGSGVVNLSAGDLVRIAFSNETSTQNLLVSHCNLLIWQLNNQ